MASALTGHEVPDVRLFDAVEFQLPTFPELTTTGAGRLALNGLLEKPPVRTQSSRSSATDDADGRVPEPFEALEEEAPQRPKRSFKRSKTAEEKAARIKARNRRAQQAFRSRQKALNVERALSLENLQTEVQYLRQVNKQLVRKIEDLAGELAELRFSSPAGKECPVTPHCVADLDGIMKQEPSDVSEDLQSVCPLVLGMIPNESLSL